MEISTVHTVLCGDLVLFLQRFFLMVTNDLNVAALLSVCLFVFGDFFVKKKKNQSIEIVIVNSVILKKSSCFFNLFFQIFSWHHN